jgi:hypothetical protein
VHNVGISSDRKERLYSFCPSQEHVEKGLAVVRKKVEEKYPDDKDVKLAVALSHAEWVASKQGCYVKHRQLCEHILKALRNKPRGVRPSFPDLSPFQDRVARRAVDMCRGDLSKLSQNLISAGFVVAAHEKSS